MGFVIRHGVQPRRGLPLCGLVSILTAMNIGRISAIMEPAVGNITFWDFHLRASAAIH
jgi:hypothetical protein